MSFFSDSYSSLSNGAYKNFKQITRERLLHDMLRSDKTGDSRLTCKVLVVDKHTSKVISHAFKTHENEISLEQFTEIVGIYKQRQPFPFRDAVYFIQPTKENVFMFMSDMSGRSPLYKKAFVYFSTPIPKELLDHIKKDKTVLSRIGALREMNLEYVPIDSQGFVTGNERALEELFADEEDSCKGDACLNVMANRIASVFASLGEFPNVRYRAAKSLDATTMTTFRDVIPTKLAARVWDRLAHYKKTIANFPQKETCELLILDRSVDPIAPVIHEWTYDAMCHDLLNMEGNTYVHEVRTDGPPEKEGILLEEHDPFWLELRDAHIAYVSERLHELNEKMTNFRSKVKAARIQPGSRDGELSAREIQKTLNALPQYTEQKDKLPHHVEIADKIITMIKELELRDIGKLEQDLVFGDAGMKDVIKFFTTHEEASRECKLRLLMILASIYPEKFDSEKGLNIMKLARLTEEDMNAVRNMRLLGSPESAKSSTGAFYLKIGMHKKNRAARKDRVDAEQTTWTLSRFYPMIEELVEKLSKGELSKDEYPTVTSYTQARSMRSRRTPTWARPQNTDNGYLSLDSDSLLRHASSDFKEMGRRIFIFIIGGATRSELRVCHKLTNKLQREVILGSSSIDDPLHFITKMKLLTAEEKLSLDDLEI